MQGGYQFVSAEYFVKQKYGSDCAGVVSLFNQCSSYSNTQVVLQLSFKLEFCTALCTQGYTASSDCCFCHAQDLQNMMALSAEFKGICPPLRVE